MNFYALLEKSWTETILVLGSHTNYDLSVAFIADSRMLNSLVIQH